MGIAVGKPAAVKWVEGWVRTGGKAGRRLGAWGCAWLTHSRLHVDLLIEGTFYWHSQSGRIVLLCSRASTGINARTCLVPP